MVTRAVRSDAGQVRLTDRDLSALGFLGDMRAVREDDLAILLGRGQEVRPSPSAVRQTVARWQRAGVASAIKLLANRPRVITLTSGGAQLVGAGSWREASVWSSAHACEVSHARLWLEECGLDSWGRVVEWTPERELRQDGMPALLRGEKRHPVDGVATFTTGVTAGVEVELTGKSLTRLATIVEKVTAEHDVVLYLAHDPAIRRAVELTYERVKAEGRAVRTGDLYALNYPAVIV